MQTNNTDPFWPDSARLVISISMQMEAGAQPKSGAESPLPRIDPKYPDIAATKWYEYGFKEGLPRLLEMFDRRKVKVTSHMVGAAVEKHPALAKEMVQRGHEPAGHGKTWTPQYSMTSEQERKSYTDSAVTIERVTGVRQVGFNAFWLRGTPQTLQILQELGYTYYIDDVSRDEPFLVNVRNKPFAVVPYTLHLNDIVNYEGRYFSTDAYAADLKREFDVLYEENEHRRRMMSVSAHDRIAGPPVCECWRISSSMHSRARQSPSCARWISRTTRSQAREPFARGFRSHSMKGKSGHLLACVVVALFLGGCERQSASSDRAQPDPIAVRIATPKHVRVPAEVVVSGTVETPSAPTTVGFLVSGKVIRVGHREGDFVKAGEILAVIDPADYQFAVEAAVAQSALARAQNEKASVSARTEVVEQARANLLQAEDEFRRMKTLYEKKSLTPNDFKKYETAYTNAQQQYDQAKEGAQQEDKAAAKAALEQAEAAERIARKRLSDSTLIAPISGFVSKRNIEEGAMASPGTPVFTIVELDPVEIEVGVPETDVRLVHRGQQAIVTASARPGISFSGRVRLVNVSAEPQTRTYMVRITVPNPKGSLLVGMIAEARILGNETMDVLTLPGQSLVRDPQGAPQVFVYFPNEKRVYARRVTVGGIMDRDVQIIDGVTGSESVVVAGQQLVREGSVVSAKEEKQ